MDTLEYFVEWHGPYVLMLGVSALYFFTDPRRPAYGARLVSSAHGLLGAALYLGAMSLHWTRPDDYRPYLGTPYAAAYVLPVLAVVVSLFTYRGPKLVHLVQLIQLPVLAWAWFVGGMAAVGEWL